MEATATAVRPATFIHKCVNQVLFVSNKGPRYERNSQGDRIGMDEGAQIHFVNNQFRADEDSARALGMSLEELLTFLRSHEMFNASLFENAMPEDASPSVKEQTRAIWEAQERRDPDAIDAILKEERDTHNRSVVIDVGTVALETIARNPQE